MGQPPGFFGKMPSHGDFVGRRLPPDVRQCFDDWLQASLVRSKQELGDKWLPIWMSSPLWRFVIGAGICGEQAWAGVMMPSHDRVGRCYPLLLMAGIDGTPSLRDCMTVHDGWFAQLEELARSTLEEDFLLGTFDACLAAQDSVLTWPRDPCVTAGFVPRLGIKDRSVPLSAPVDGAWPELVDWLAVGQSAWWSDGSQVVAPVLVISRGLPAPQRFAALLNGRWAEHEWQV